MATVLRASTSNGRSTGATPSASVNTVRRPCNGASVGFATVTEPPRPSPTGTPPQNHDWSMKSALVSARYFCASLPHSCSPSRVRPAPPRVFVSAGAIGYYGDRGEEAVRGVSFVVHAGEILADHARRSGLDAERALDEIKALQGLRSLG